MPMQYHERDDFITVRQYSTYRGMIPAPNGFHTRGIQLDNTKWQHVPSTVEVNFGVTLHESKNRVIIKTVLGRTDILDYIDVIMTSSYDTIQFSYRLLALSCKYLAIEGGCQVMKRFQLEFNDNAQLSKVVFKLRQLKCLVKEVPYRCPTIAVQERFPYTKINDFENRNFSQNYYQNEENNTQCSFQSFEGGDGSRNTALGELSQTIHNESKQNTKEYNHDYLTGLKISYDNFNNNQHVSHFTTLGAYQDTLLEPVPEQNENNHILGKKNENANMNYLSQSSTYRNFIPIRKEDINREIAESTSEIEFLNCMYPGIFNHNDEHATSFSIVPKESVKPESRDKKTEIEYKTLDNVLLKNNEKNVPATYCSSTGEGKNSPETTQSREMKDSECHTSAPKGQLSFPEECNTLDNLTSAKNSKYRKLKSKKGRKMKVSRKLLEEKLRDQKFMKWVCITL